MSKKVEITVENKLIMEKRDINVYHHSTRSAHMLSHNSSITFPFQTADENDYLHISVVSGPGFLENTCLIDVPSWIDFELSIEGKAAVTHTRNRILVKLPPGPPSWELKMTRTTAPLNTRLQDKVIIGDEEAGGGNTKIKKNKK
ncbi:MAG: hypothetical protein JSV88_10000 [Candidatus Aminicenantes bacterium]|nr:MAG: hypothetical protein JSV88_10000 [Candidatus Aminicenantes bacterium]